MHISVRDYAAVQPFFATPKAALDEMGIDAIELEYFRDRSVYALDAPGGAKVSLATPADIDAFGRKCAQLGVKPSALLLHNNFAADDLDAEVDWVISCIKAAAQLGVRAVRIDAIMSTERDWPLDKRTQHFADCIARVLDANSGNEVQMGIENHGFQGNDPEFLDMVISKVGSPKLGVTIDTGNFYWRGYPLSRVHQIIEHFAPLCKHTHVKSINYPANIRETEREIGYEYGACASGLREGDIDILRVVKALREAGYNGDLCIENESIGGRHIADPKQVLLDDAAYLREIMQKTA